MPALKNPRHEAFARAIFAGLFQPNPYPTHGHAYVAVGYRAKGVGEAGGSAEVNASRLLKNAKILDRVRELQQQAAELTKETAEKCVQELNELRRDAHSNKAYGAAVAAVMGKAKILNLTDDQHQFRSEIDFSQASSLEDLGRRLLQAIGFKEPDDVSIKEAMAANDEFIKELERIRNAAQGLTLEE